MEFGCSDIESTFVKYNSNCSRTGEFPECCTRSQQKIFTKKREKLEEERHRKLAARRASPLQQMAAIDEVTTQEHLATKDDFKRTSDVETIPVNDGSRHVHFGDEIVTQEFPFARLSSISKLKVKSVSCLFCKMVMNTLCVKIRLKLTNILCLFSDVTSVSSWGQKCYQLYYMIKFLRIV